MTWRRVIGVAGAFAGLAISVGGCATAEAPRVDGASGAAVVYDHHNARNALDWSGAYEGVVPGVGPTRLFLEAYETYALEQQGEILRGHFTWLPDGNTIELDDAAQRQHVFVSEGYVI